LRALPERCLPADSLLPGHNPAHEAGEPPRVRWRLVG